MRTVTPQFLEAVKRPYTLAITVEVMDPDDVVVVSNLPIKGGSVTVDAGSEIRYTGSITVSDIALLPKLPTDPLAPYGNRVRIRRGLRYQNGTFERVTTELSSKPNHSSWVPKVMQSRMTRSDANS